MTMDKKLIVSMSPHIHGNDSIHKNMYRVILALVPAFLCSIWFFGWHALVTTAIAIVSCMGFEYLITRYIFKRPSTLKDCSAMLTGLLLAFNVPADLPWWIVVIGSIFAIGVVKMSFGGLGNNIFNPALAGRVFLLVSFPQQMTTWPALAHSADAVTGATPLALIKAGNFAELPSHLEMFLGNVPGSMGEVAALALLIGVIYLLCTKTITWHIPVSILATVFIFSGILYLCDSTVYADPLTHLLSGGLMLGACFMATDYVTSPMSHKGQLIYGAGIGILTVLIRCYGSYPEGMSFAILIMNAVTPLINVYCKPKRFGEVKK